jgi:hypothetical protein
MLSWNAVGFLWTPRTFAPIRESCRVYWGSHGCQYERGHDGHCKCECCECVEHDHDALLDDGDGIEYICVGAHPYYGEMTRFYGEDVEARGLSSLTASA